MKKITTVGLSMLFAWGVSLAGDDLNQSLRSMGLNLYLPSFSARISLGFNYDLLWSPLDVSFDQPKGYFGFNVPVEQTLNLRSLSTMNPAIDNLFGDSTLIRNGSDFKPTAGARQNPNITVHVDIPMLGGVASFSNSQNMYLNYETLLGNPNIFLNYDTTDPNSKINFLLRGTLSVPLSLSMSWETMTFSYAFMFNKNLTVAAALSRHVFSADLRGKIDADILGRYDIVASQSGSAGFETKGPLDYPSERIHGSIYGYYDAVAWTPTLAVQWWRFSLVSRFGFRTRAHGELNATYSLPFFIDPETFKMKYDLGKPETFLDPQFLMGLQTNAADSLSYTTARTSNGRTLQSDMEWRLPTGLTVGFDIIRDHISISYTKLFGAVGLKLDRVLRVRNEVQGGTVFPGPNDSLVLDIGFTVDNVIMTRFELFKAYMNLGIFGMDMWSASHKNIISKAMKGIKYGSLAPLPVLNVGTVFGTRWQVPAEIDLLPFPAVRSGLVYNF